MFKVKMIRAAMLVACAGICGPAYGGVRVIHASPDAPPVDVYVNGDPGVAMPNISGLAFTQGTGYVPLPTDTYRFRVTPAGAAAPVVIDATSPIDGSTIGTVAEASEAMKACAKIVDRTAAKGVIHKNQAARRKSRMSAALKAKKTSAK